MKLGAPFRIYPQFRSCDQRKQDDQYRGVNMVDLIQPLRCKDRLDNNNQQGKYKKITGRGNVEFQAKPIARNNIKEWNFITV